jgi:hypothetical protein
MTQCTNCGKIWQLDGADVRADRTSKRPACPVCNFRKAQNTETPAPIASISELEVQLDTLMRNARASGLDKQAIARVLSAELNFAAEIGHTGRRFVVQLIDIGPQEAVQRSPQAPQNGYQIRPNDRNNT